MRDPFDGLAFRPADILLPQNCDYTKWSVVACDQYTSQPEYWQEVEELVAPPHPPAPDPARELPGRPKPWRPTSWRSTTP